MNNKITITINQAQAVQMGLNVDLVDLALLDYCQNYLLSTKAKRVFVADHLYVQVNPSDIINDMPLLRLATTKSINNHIDSLVDAELLERCPDNQKLRGTFIGAGRRYDEYIGIEAVSAPSTTVKPTVEAPKVIKKPYEFEGLDLPHTEPRFIEWLDRLAQEDIWKKKSRQAWTMAFNSLKRVPEPVASTAIAITIDRHYRGVFPESVKPDEVTRYLYPASAPAQQKPQTTVRSVKLDDIM